MTHPDHYFAPGVIDSSTTRQPRPQSLLAALAQLLAVLAFLAVFGLLVGFGQGKKDIDAMKACQGIDVQKWADTCLKPKQEPRP